MDKTLRPERLLFAIVMMALGLLGLIYGDFAMVWQPVPAGLPGRTALAYATAVLELLAGAGLLLPRTARLSARVLFVFLTLWVLTLRVPTLLRHPQVELAWLGFGETASIWAGVWCLFAGLAGDWERKHLGFAVGESGLRCARYLFAVALPMIGLSHYFYSDATVSYIPAWIPFPLAGAYLAGAGDIGAGLGIFFGVWPRLAATMEAAMQSTITLIVWVPTTLDKPHDRLQWTALVTSTLIASGCWLVAGSYRGGPWRSVNLFGRKPG